MIHVFVFPFWRLRLTIRLALLLTCEVILIVCILLILFISLDYAVTIELLLQGINVLGFSALQDQFKELIFLRVLFLNPFDPLIELLFNLVIGVFDLAPEFDQLQFLLLHGDLRSRVHPVELDLVDDLLCIGQGKDAQPKFVGHDEDQLGLVDLLLLLFITWLVYLDSAYGQIVLAVVA